MAVQKLNNEEPQKKGNPFARVGKGVYNWFKRKNQEPEYDFPEVDATEIEPEPEPEPAIEQEDFSTNIETDTESLEDIRTIIRQGLPDSLEINGIPSSNAKSVLEGFPEWQEANQKLAEIKTALGLGSKSNENEENKENKENTESIRENIIAKISKNIDNYLSDVNKLINNQEYDKIYNETEMSLSFNSKMDSEWSKYSVDLDTTLSIQKEAYLKNYSKFYQTYESLRRAINESTLDNKDAITKYCQDAIQTYKRMGGLEDKEVELIEKQCENDVIAKQKAISSKLQPSKAPQEESLEDKMNEARTNVTNTFIATITNYKKYIKNVDINEVVKNGKIDSLYDQLHDAFYNSYLNSDELKNGLPKYNADLIFKYMFTFIMGTIQSNYPEILIELLAMKKALSSPEVDVSSDLLKSVEDEIAKIGETIPQTLLDRFMKQLEFNDTKEKANKRAEEILQTLPKKKAPTPSNPEPVATPSEQNDTGYSNDGVGSTSQSLVPIYHMPTYSPSNKPTSNEPISPTQEPQPTSQVDNNGTSSTKESETKPVEPTNEPTVSPVNNQPSAGGPIKTAADSNQEPTEAPTEPVPQQPVSGEQPVQNSNNDSSKYPEDLVNDYLNILNGIQNAKKQQATCMSNLSLLMNPDNFDAKKMASEYNNEVSLISQLDIEISKAEVELSKIRTECIPLHIYLPDNERIKAKLNEISQISPNKQESLQDFVKKNDTISVLAEIELSKIDVSEQETRKDEINLLQSIIRNENYIIKRMILSEYEYNNSLDIKQVIMNRTANKNELRQNLKTKVQKNPTPEIAPEQTKEITSEVASEQTPEITPEQLPESDITVEGNLKKLNLKNIPKINKKTSIIMNGNQVTVKLLQNAINIKVNENIAKKLQELQMKITLLSKKQGNLAKVAEKTASPNETEISITSDDVQNIEAVKNDIENGNTSIQIDFINKDNEIEDSYTGSFHRR